MDHSNNFYNIGYGKEYILTPIFQNGECVGCIDQHCETSDCETCKQTKTCIMQGYEEPEGDN